MKRLHGAHRGIAMALVAVAAAICIAACGGSSNASSTTTNTTAKTAVTTTTHSASSRFTALRACLAKHGVKLPAGRAGFRGGAGGFFGGTHTGTTPAGGAPGTGGAPGAGGTPGAGGAPGAGRGFFGGAFANSKDAKAFKACGGAFPAGNFRGGFGAGAGTVRHAFSTKVLDSFVACVRKNGYPAMPSAKRTATGGFFPPTLETNAKFRAASIKCASILQRTYIPRTGAPNQPLTTSTTSST